MPAVNRLGDLSIKWHKLGEAGVTIIERGLYQRAANKERGRLGAMATSEVVAKLNTEILPAMPHGNDRLNPSVVDVDFMGEGTYVSIAYIFDCPQLTEQWSYITDQLDRLNGVNSGWGDFEPHLSIATIEAINAEDAILNKFWEFAPKHATLLPAVAQ
jgi:hypothetical protein